MPVFGDLTYNKKTLKPIGRPVDDLKDLYAKKGEDYNYVIDNLNATETALNAIPFEDKDKAIIDAAKQKYQDTFKGFAEQGDFEKFLDDGWAIILYDSTQSFGESGGRAEDVTITQRAADLERVVNYSKRRSYINNQKIVIIFTFIFSFNLIFIRLNYIFLFSFRNSG